MYTFAIIALLALATLKVVDILVDLMPGLAGMRSLLTLVLSVGALWLVDFSMFDAWGVAVRDHTVGVVLTGVAVAGMTTAWRAVFGYLTHDHATLDETLGERRGLRQVA